MLATITARHDGALCAEIEAMGRVKLALTCPKSAALSWCRTGMTKVRTGLSIARPASRPACRSAQASASSKRRCRIGKPRGEVGKASRNPATFP